MVGGKVFVAVVGGGRVGLAIACWVSWATAVEPAETVASANTV
jgi:hypothetical protein